MSFVTLLTNMIKFFRKPAQICSSTFIVFMKYLLYFSTVFVLREKFSKPIRS